MKNFFQISKLQVGALVLSLCLTSCVRSWLEPYSEHVDVRGEELEHGMIVLGKQLEDPYSLDNMTKAYESLYSTKADRVPLSPTDYYVRFLPSNQDQYDELEADGLILLDHPVDFEILREGDYYHDPTIPEDEITWQYAVVGMDYNFPKHIKYEILDSCYISDNNPFTKIDGVDWGAVEREAYKISGNEHLLLPQTRSEAENTPTGQITIEDEGFGVEGVKGVRVSCNTFAKFASCYTDEEGKYVFDKSFSSEPRYRIVFKNKYGFGIGFNLIFSPASSSTLGKHPASGVDIHIDSSSDRKLFTRSVVNNAGYDYFSQCKQKEFSIKLPPTNLRIWLFQNLRSSSAIMMQQGVIFDESKIADYLGEYAFLLKMFLPDVTIGLKDCIDYEQIYTLAIHEFAHASHFMQAGKTYWNKYAEFITKSYISSGFVTYGTGAEEDHGYCEIGEMWAYYVQTVIHNERYVNNPKIYGSNYWFSPQIFLYMDERGLGRHKIFAALTSDVSDTEILEKKLKSLHPQFKTTINQAFTRYQ